MDGKFTDRAKNVLAFSREEVQRLGNNYLGLEHLLLGIIREGEGLAIQLLSYFGVDIAEVKKNIEHAIKEPYIKGDKLENIPMSRQAVKALKITYLEAKALGSDLVGTEHMLLAILKDDKNLASNKLEKYGVDYIPNICKSIYRLSYYFF